MRRFAARLGIAIYCATTGGGKGSKMENQNVPGRKIEFWKLASISAERTEIFVGLLLLGATAFGMVLL
mgnify:CR=1 FL=1